MTALEKQFGCVTTLIHQEHVLCIIFQQYHYINGQNGGSSNLETRQQILLYENFTCVHESITTKKKKVGTGKEY